MYFVIDFDTALEFMEEYLRIRKQLKRPASPVFLYTQTCSFACNYVGPLGAQLEPKIAGERIILMERPAPIKGPYTLLLQGLTLERPGYAVPQPRTKC